MKIQKSVIPLIVLVAIINVLIIAFPSVALQGARDGLFLWFNNVLPGILPFVIGANVLMALGVVKVLGVFLNPLMRFVFKLPGKASFPFAMGMISGYPVGAKIVCEMRQKGELSKSDAQRLLAFTNNGGPLFILGAVGVGMFASSALGYLILIVHYGVAILMGFTLSFFARKDRAIEYDGNYKMLVIDKKQPFGKVLGEAVKNAMETMVLIGGFMVLFSVVSALLVRVGVLNILPESAYTEGVVKGLLEAAGGVAAISQEGASAVVAGITVGIISFGGLSIMFQTLSFVSKTDLNQGLYVVSKVLHGFVSGVVLFLLYPFFATTIEAQATQATFAPTITQTFISSTINFFALLLGLGVLCLIFIFLKLFKRK